jgi:chemotaxis receptor (MCP) glutamine deamidase CheD
MVRIYQTERGYFYKEYKNGKKVRISKKSAFKNMKGGGMYNCKKNMSSNKLSNICEKKKNAHPDDPRYFETYEECAMSTKCLTKWKTEYTPNNKIRNIPAYFINIPANVRNIPANFRNIPDITYKTGPFNQENLKTVLQHEVSITDSKKKKYLIGTFGVGPCIAIIGYEPEHHIGFVAHIDSLTTPYEHNLIVSMLSDKYKNMNLNFELYIIGGDSDTVEQLKILYNKWKVFKHTPYGTEYLFTFNVLGKNILGNNPKEVILDTKNGQLYLYKDKTKLSNNENRRLTRFAHSFLFNHMNGTKTHIKYVN